MDFGVKITQGAVPWQIFQQSDNGCTDIKIKGTYHLVQLSQELPLQFTKLDHKKTVVKARIALENSGESVVQWQECTILDNENWETCFTNVPAGGLYRIETYMDFEGWNGLSCTRGDMVHNIGVGDVFVIAGQSNAAGRAKTPITDTPEIGVHVMRPSTAWDLATHPLGETTNSVHTGNFENHNPGHSPWLHFAKILKGQLGYPIGLVPCAYGGAPLRWWNPDENGELFKNMMNMLDEYAIKPKAVLWYQGEAEAYENSAETYFERFSAFVNHTRKALDNEKLPFITVQLNSSLEAVKEEFDRSWGMVRETQRKAMHDIKNVMTVPSTDLSMYDFVHNSPQSNLVIGERCANAALAEIYGKNIDWRAPEPKQAKMIENNKILLEFSGIKNWINTYEVPGCLIPFNAEDDNGLVSPVVYEIKDNVIELEFERDLIGEIRLHGAWKMNPGHAIPNDCMRLPMLSFYNFTVQK